MKKKLLVLGSIITFLSVPITVVISCSNNEQSEISFLSEEAKKIDTNKNYFFEGTEEKISKIPIGKEFTPLMLGLTFPQIDESIKISLLIKEKLNATAKNFKTIVILSKDGHKQTKEIIVTRINHKKTKKDSAKKKNANQKDITKKQDETKKKELLEKKKIKDNWSRSSNFIYNYLTRNKDKFITSYNEPELKNHIASQKNKNFKNIFETLGLQSLQNWSLKFVVPEDTIWSAKLLNSSNPNQGLFKISFVFKDLDLAREFSFLVKFKKMNNSKKQTGHQKFKYF